MGIRYNANLTHGLCRCLVSDGSHVEKLDSPESQRYTEGEQLLNESGLPTGRRRVGSL